MPTWDPGSPFRSWLRKSPKPAKVRVTVEDGDQRIVELSADVRTRWKTLEETVLACRPISVECLDDKGAVLRAKTLELEDDPDGGSGAVSFDAQRKESERLQSRERREMGSLLDAYGRQLNVAFDKGAAAANTGQENLVGLVEVLTQHLSLAITNLHNVSVNLANVVAQSQEEGGGGNDNEALVGKVLGMVAARSMGAGPAEPVANGKGKRT